MSQTNTLANEDKTDKQLVKPVKQPNFKPLPYIQFIDFNKPILLSNRDFQELPNKTIRYSCPFIELDHNLINIPKMDVATAEAESESESEQISSKASNFADGFNDITPTIGSTYNIKIPVDEKGIPLEQVDIENNSNNDSNIKNKLLSDSPESSNKVEQKLNHEKEQLHKLNSLKNKPPRSGNKLHSNVSGISNKNINNIEKNEVNEISNINSNKQTDSHFITVSNTSEHVTKSDGAINTDINNSDTNYKNQKVKTDSNIANRLNSTNLNEKNIEAIKADTNLSKDNLKDEKSANNIKENHDRIKKYKTNKQDGIESTSKPNGDLTSSSKNILNKSELLNLQNKNEDKNKNKNEDNNKIDTDENNDNKDDELTEEEKEQQEKESKLESYKQYIAKQKNKIDIDYQEVRVTIEANALPSRLYFIMNALSAIIASYGLVVNSPAVVIGAMLVAMMLGPITGAALAIIDYRIPFLRKSLFTILAGASMVVTIGYIVGFIHKDAPLTNEILSRTQPTSMDLMIALAGGIAGAYAMISPHLSVAVVGVAVATALVPPLAASGILMAHGETSLGLGALLLAITNIIAIQFTNALVLWFSGFRRLIKDDYKTNTLVAFLRRNMVPIVLLIGLSVYLTYNFNTISKKQKFENEVKQIINDYFIDKGNALTATQFISRDDHQTVRAVLRGETHPSAQDAINIETTIQERIESNYPNYQPVRIQIRYMPVVVIDSSYGREKEEITTTDAAILSND